MESVAPARLAGLLGAPSIHPITVILAIRRECIVSTKSQGAVNLTEAGQRPIYVRGRERRNAGRKLNVRRSRDPLIWAAEEAANMKTPTAWRDDSHCHVHPRRRMNPSHGCPSWGLRRKPLVSMPGEGRRQPPPHQADVFLARTPGSRDPA